ncbi:MAG TPA: 2-oxoacid:acceptor oxidoreductase subunit alpha [Deltaproteobacteria bacterium]|nr:2-oxoacid:acceptor oxidoreductase subunit alpha [Deltaproteobacteria bacterium]
MDELSILIGGKAGDGIRQAGTIIGKLIGRLGYRIFLYDDYPSLIRGGHNFSVIRASGKKVLAHKDKVDIIVALNQDTVEKHHEALTKNGIILYDSDKVKSEGVGLPFSQIVKEHEGAPIMRNTAAIGAFAKMIGAEWSLLERVIKDTEKKATSLNLKIAEASYRLVGQRFFDMKQLPLKPLPIVSGNEAIALGAVQAGLNLYIAYPMTPASSILHYLASHEDELGIVTVHPENEIAVAVMALGAAYAGARTMVGTSGGGFALMTEAISLASQGEYPVVFVECQRAGPSTGVPTYTMQADLHFVLNAGHGDIVRFVVAPGDTEEAFYLTALAMNIAWEFQIPTFVLSDKHLSESLFSFDPDTIEIGASEPLLWDKKAPYKRYSFAPNGVSPLAFPGDPEATVKGTSYEHDEYGITTEDPAKIQKMQDKRLSKKPALKKRLQQIEQVKIYGNENSKTAIICWGSTKGVCTEIAEELDIKVVQPLIMEPFPVESLKNTLADVNKVIDIETNATGQLARLLACNGITIHETILRYDSRPFTVDGLLNRVKEVIS